MEFFEVIRERRSIRKYKDLPVAAETIEKILEAARMAPSWHNQQCWRFLVLTSATAREKLLDVVSDANPVKKGLHQAPVVIVICGCPEESSKRDGKEYYMADAAIAFEHICLAAKALGLGTCWIGGFDEGALKQILGIPETVRIVGMTPLGYPDQEPNPRPRKALSEIAFIEKWGSPLAPS